MIDDVLVDGVSVGAVASYTFTNVRADHTISATFQRSAVGDMPIAGIDCDACHRATASRTAATATTCSTPIQLPPGNASVVLPHPGHVTGCASCHDSSLTIEHNGRKTDADADIVCVTCHAEHRPAVTRTDREAIYLRGTPRARACHADLTHPPTARLRHRPATTTATPPSAGCTNSGAGCHGADGHGRGGQHPRLPPRGYGQCLLSAATRARTRQRRPRLTPAPAAMTAPSRTLPTPSRSPTLTGRPLRRDHPHARSA